jgi:hypothetical protein
MTKYSGKGADRERDRATERQVASRGVYRTERPRLVPIDARHAPEIWELHQDEGIARWYPLSRQGAECVEIGWALRQEVWGRGYATEIGCAGLDHAFSVLGVEEVVAFTEVHNVRSRAVMERLGMRYVRQILRPGLIAGSSEMHKDAPFVLYRITRAAHDPS